MSTTKYLIGMRLSESPNGNDLHTYFDRLRPPDTDACRIFEAYEP